MSPGMMRSREEQGEAGVTVQLGEGILAVAGDLRRRSPGASTSMVLASSARASTRSSTTRMRLAATAARGGVPQAGVPGPPRPPPPRGGRAAPSCLAPAALSILTAPRPLSDEAIDHGQAEPGSLAFRLGAEERIERGFSTVGDMPVPVSVTETTRIGRPGGCPTGDMAAAPRRGSRCRPWTRPPPAMASRAFTTKASTAISGCPGSTRQSAARSRGRNDRDGSPTVRPTMSPIAPTSAFRFTVRPSQRLLAREGEKLLGEGRRAPGGLADIRELPVSGLSDPATQATFVEAVHIADDDLQQVVEIVRDPAVSWPSASIFWAWRNAVSASLRRHMSSCEEKK